MQEILLKYMVLAVLWIAWCTLHSGLISIFVTDFMKLKLGNRFKYYRVIFNTISLVTLIPVLVYSHSVQTVSFFGWNGFLRIVQVLMVLLSIILFYTGGRHYSVYRLMGISQIRTGKSNGMISAGSTLDMTGVMGVVRHPWYSGVLILIWARSLDVSALIVNIILTLYIVIGTYLEERKLVIEMGDSYREYCKQVSMFFPFIWIRKKSGLFNDNKLN